MIFNPINRGFNENLQRLILKENYKVHEKILLIPLFSKNSRPSSKINSKMKILFVCTQF